MIVDASCIQTVNMSKIPMLKLVEKNFTNIISALQAYEGEPTEIILISYLHTFLNNPHIRLHLGFNTQASPPPDSPPSHDSNKITSIKETLKTITKAVEGLQKKAHPPSKKTPTAQSMGTPPARQTRTYLAASGSRPPNPSIVVGLAHIEFTDQNRPQLDQICEILNWDLSDKSPHQVHIVAVRWIAKGNLIVMGGPATTPQLLNTASHLIAETLTRAFQLPNNEPPPQTRANICWSKLLINGVPTRASKDQSPHSPEKCHQALIAANPSYATLLVMQKPS